MRIGIDGNEANVTHRVGVHQYSFEILWGLYEQNSKAKSKEVFTIYLRQRPVSDLPKATNWWQYRVLPGARVWILSRLTPYLLLHNEVDVLFVPSHYLPPISRVPMVCVVHDLGYLEFSDQFKKYDFWQLKCWTAISIAVSKRIITVSNFNSKDIVRHYPSASRKLDVVHHGYDNSRFRSDISKKDVRRVTTKYHVIGDYLLYLGTLKPSKNIEGLIEAYSNLHQKLAKIPPLVIAGKKGWLYENIFAKVKALGLESKVHFTDFVVEKDKPSLIHGAKLLVSPSFWEGFGMHVLESMACGTPVLVSKIASLPEVAGKAGIYADAYDPNDIAEKIAYVLSLPSKEYNRLVRASVSQANKFSWATSAKNTLDILKQAANS